MWSEEFDKKTKEAANSHEPGFEEKNWDRMELLLDKHLPTEKKKRRFIFWIILPIMAGITALTLVTIKSGKQENKLSSLPKTETTIPVNSAGTAETKTLGPADDQLAAEQTGSPDFKEKEPDKFAEPNNSGTIQLSANEYSKYVNKPAQPVLTKKDDNNLFSTTNPGSRNGINRQKNEKIRADQKNQQTEMTVAPVPLISNPGSTPVSPAEPLNGDLNAQQSSENNNNISRELIDSTVKNADSVLQKTVTTARKKPGLSREKGFFAGISLGPELSGLGMNQPGTWKMQFGFTAGYAFSKRWSLRTGFFAGRKVYTAAPSEYHPPYDIITYFPTLEKIDANCLVYEIPLSLVYHFPSAKKYNWFVSGGASSYLMKDETYVYNFKNPAGLPDQRTRNFSDENSHFFSVINISGGIHYRFNERFFLLAEPFFKIPVNGVGYGKVKLNSAGAMFTMGLKF